LIVWACRLFQRLESHLDQVSAAFSSKLLEKIENEAA